MASRADHIWEVSGSLISIFGCLAIAAQVIAEYGSPRGSSLSMINLIGFVILYGFWASYGWRYRRTAIWVGNAIACLFQIALLVIVCGKGHGT